MGQFRSIAVRLLPSPLFLKRWRAEELGQLAPGEVGQIGEKLAAIALRRDGLKLLQRNFKAVHGGEADLVCRDGDVLVFIEVKTRRSTQYGRPADAVDKEKQRLLTRGAAAWLRLIEVPPAVIRFDIVEVLLLPGKRANINRIEDAFQSPDDYVL